MNSPFEPEILSNNNDGNSDLDDDPEFITRKQARSNKEITVRIALPVDGASGKPLYGIGQGLKKKEAERLACLDALEELDKNGVLSLQDNARPGRRAKRRNDRNESDDEFDDEFYDRTQTKVRRKADNKPETFESLSEKLQMAEKDIEQIQRDINKLEKNNAADSNGKVVQDDDGDGEGDGDGDELDAYMYALEKGQQASEKKQLETRLAELEKEKDRLVALIKLVAPDEPVASKKREDHSVTQAKRVAETREPVSDLPEPKRQRQSHGPTLRQIVESQKEAADKDPGKTSHIGGQEALTKRIEDDKTVEWQPPAGQTGDGRTSLNDKLGY
ncbi:Kanadaptin [Coemansia asiatica]|uniref:Kanadaptin n=1 Tax=Coemansia asiatica TaxID=1052880 RepID=A0A9W7XH84_9FUNG|nr:Kanadaptin [Coemansia asiatica]